jgi:hypothetical protein
MKLIPLALLVLICAPEGQRALNAARDFKIVSSAKRASAHKLDDALPDLAFEKWLRKESGPDAQYHWEVNDCGEQTGSQGDTGPVPTCVEVDSTLKDGREIIILVGDDSPHRSKIADWRIFFAQLVTVHEKINLRRLSDLPAALIRTHQIVHYPEIAK